MKIIQMEAAVYLFLLCFSSTISIKTDESIQELKNQIMKTNILVKEMKIMMSHLIEKQSTCTSESEGLLNNLCKLNYISNNFVQSRFFKDN